MALNLKLKLLLWLNKIQNKPNIEDVSPPEARKMQREMNKKLSVLTEYKIDDLHEIKDVQIPSEGQEITLRIYRPQDEEQLPILMFFHGGGFVIGDLEIYDAFCRRMAKLSNCVVISVDYRLAPEFKYPAAPNDCYNATCWAEANAESFQGDPDKIAVMGDSAGGNLATVVAMMARDKAGPKISQQVLIYPTTDASFAFASIDELAEGYLLTKSLMKWFLNHYRDQDTDPLDPYFSPIESKDLRGLPPSLVITAEYDPLKDEGRAYAEKLQSAGVPVLFKEFKGMTHVFIQMPKFLKKSRQAQALIAQELKTIFGVDGLVRKSSFSA